MSGTWLIVNSASGSFAPARVEAIVAAFAAGGRPVTRTIRLPEEPLPDAAAAHAGAPELIAIFTGDGTVSAAVDRLGPDEGAWNGPLLILPGGTMNLLARKLHGDGEAEAIVAAALGGPFKTVRMMQARGCGQQSLVGIIAGPTTAWGAVREDLRNTDLAALAKSVPQALDKTLNGDPMTVAGVDGHYQAIFVEPQQDMLEATGIKAANFGELLQHGFAWLNRDFLGGPTEPLLRARQVTIGGEDVIGLLVDGERASARGPCTFTLVPCPLAFVTTAGEAA
ncbi:diacylglycerol/lipid kinase family protein [Sphingobium aquiterrae]|uniref:diacylglycerol/lipid kinase family protein n=1 Tax=Sphingobium aquiterrae TaxID=2038656 RepID=UPI003018FA44